MVSPAEIVGYTDVKNSSATLFGMMAASSMYSQLTDLPRIPLELVAAVNILEPFSSSMSPLVPGLYSLLQPDRQQLVHELISIQHFSGSSGFVGQDCYCLV